MWRCKKTNCQLKNNNWYIGLSKRKFKTRISEHRDYVKSENLNEPSGEHFNKPGHSIHDFEAMVLEQVREKDPYILRARESFYIKKFDTFHKGLNQEP